MDSADFDFDYDELWKYNESVLFFYPIRAGGPDHDHYAGLEYFLLNSVMWMSVWRAPMAIMIQCLYLDTSRLLVTMFYR